MMGHYVYLNQRNNHVLYIQKIGVSLSLILFMSKANAASFDVLIKTGSSRQKRH